MKAPKNPKSEDKADAPNAVDSLKAGPVADAVDQAGTDTDTEAEAEPQPEPWTPERVVEWNRYYDLYVAAAALLLVFLVATHKLAGSAVWPLVQAGRRTLQNGWPLLADPFAYTTYGRVWVNYSWLYQVVLAGLMKIGPALSPVDPEQQLQVGATAMILFTSLARVLTGCSLLAIRRPGPGMWWSAIALALGLGIIVAPTSTSLGTVLGGLAGSTDVTPSIWGTCFFAFTILALFRMYDQRRRAAGWWLVPLFVLWANMDDSFLLGLIAVGLAVLGQAIRPSRTDDESSDSRSAWGGVVLLACCSAACLVNPSVQQVFVVAAQPFRYMIQRYPAEDMPVDFLGFFDARSASHYQRATGLSIRVFQAFYFAVLGLGVLTFVLNRQRFSLARLLTLLVFGLFWGLANRLSGPFAVVFAATIALNGQEWYLDRFGVEGRLGWRWATWSVGGRLVTLALLTLAMLQALTGWGSQPGDFVFGFGLDRSDFCFDAAEALRAANLRGRVLNTSASVGDDLIARTDGQVQVFFDSRRGLYGPSFYDFRSKLVRSLRDGQKDGPDGWAETLKPYGVSAVVVRSMYEPRLEETLHSSPDWVEVYADGAATVFGRLDTEYPEDLAYFKAHAFDLEAMAFRRDQPVASPDRPPASRQWFLDLLDRRRTIEKSEPHNLMAQRFLTAPRGSSQRVPEPAQCIMAIRAARTALSRKPDDPDAFRALVQAYQGLYFQEGELLRTSGVEAAPQLLLYRKRQLMTALNYAIQTTPPPTTERDREGLRELHLTMANELRRSDAYDMEMDHLAEAAKLFVTEPAPPELKARLEKLQTEIAKFREALETKTVENNWRPGRRAQEAIQAGALGMGIQELRKEEGSPRVKPDLVDLFCTIGQPDEAYLLMRNDGLEDPELSTGPGTAAYREGLVTLLALGNYDATASFWYERALTQVRTSMTMEGLMAVRGLVAGDPLVSVNTNLELPSRVLAEADWCYQLGLCLLEGGRPLSRKIDVPAQPGAPPRQQEIPGAAEMFEKALELEPDLPVRPIIAYYLEKIGRPLPAEKETETLKPDAPPSEAPAAPTSAAEEKPQANPEEKPQANPEEKPQANPGA